MSHTKGKLEVRTYDGSLGSIDTEFGDMVAQAVQVVGDNREQETRNANARRLVACWNLLLPFTTEEIEAGIDLEKLVRENAALKAEVERLRKDAERYRWLRDKGFQHANVDLGEDIDGDPFVEFKPVMRIPEFVPYEDSDWTASQIDEAIDAAMKETK